MSQQHFEVQYIGFYWCKYLAFALMTTYLNGTGLMVNWPIEKKPINLFYSKKKIKEKKILVLHLFGNFIKNFIPVNINKAKNVVKMFFYVPGKSIPQVLFHRALSCIVSQENVHFWCMKHGCLGRQFFFFFYLFVATYTHQSKHLKSFSLISREIFLGKSSSFAVFFFFFLISFYLLKKWCDFFFLFSFCFAYHQP